MHSGGSDQTTNILVYITTFHRALQKKRKKGRLKALQQLTYTTNYSSQTSKPSYHSIINLCTASIAAERLSGESMTMQLFLKDNLSSVFCFCFWTAFAIKVEIYRQYIGPGCTRSAVDFKRYSNISQVYRSWLHSLGTRSAVDLLKVFTTSTDIR